MERKCLCAVIFMHVIFGTEGTIKSNQPIVEYYNFGDIQYVFFSQRVTWEEANMLCSSFNGKLAVLNNMQKATYVAQAMAESDIEMEDAWLGARRFHSTWYWIHETNASFSHREIPTEPDIDGFPPWSRQPLRPMKECLAIDRKLHSLPNFIDLDCRLLRPYVCEKRPGKFINNPVPSKWIKVGNSMYTLYHGKVSWTEAVRFCRSQGMRLAVVSDQYLVRLLSHGMTMSRPDFENVWIGARYSYGNWMWLSTGSVLGSISNDNGYPPWRFGKPEKNAGCLLLDRHLENKSSFIEMVCDAKRDFLCEEYPEGELENWMNEPIKLYFDNVSIMIYPMEKTWDESKLYCQEKGSILTYVHNLSLAESLVTAMGDHPREISHLWLGGLYNSNSREWRWIYDNKIIPISEEFGYPPWAQSVMDADTLSEDSECLNLDRVDHTRPHYYGLNCESKQAFACTLNCETPPPVADGNWKCTNFNSTFKSCSLLCEKGFLTVGVKTVNCSSQIGWFNMPNWLEFPFCSDPNSYSKRLLRSVSHDLQKASGYYVLLSHSNEEFNNLALQLTQKLLSLFPLSTQRKMGMSSYFKDIRKNIPLNQNDTCTTLQLLLLNEKLPSGEHQNDTGTSSNNEWFTDIENNGRKTLIIAIIDSNTAKQNQEIFKELRTAGHYVVVIGLNDDWETLMSLATIGFDQRLNIFLLNNEDFKNVVDNLKSMKDRSPKCNQQNLNSISYTTANELTSLIKDYSTLPTTVPTTEEITFSPIAVPSTEQPLQNSDNVLTTMSPVSQSSTSEGTGDPGINKAQSSEETSTPGKDFHEITNTEKNQDKSSNEATEVMHLDGSTSADGLQTTDIEPTTLTTNLDV